MALRAVIDHPKFMMLKATLGLSRFQALGLLESIWHFTGRFTPQGNIGKYSNSQIAAWIEWGGNNKEMINALVSSGWIDIDEKYRLVIHDWANHADDATRLTLKRKNLKFIDGVPTVSLQCRDGVATISDGVPTVSGLPEPEPEPEPVPEPDKKETGTKKKSSSTDGVPTVKQKNPKGMDLPPESEPIPPELDTLEFRRTWFEDWIPHRSKMKLKTKFTAHTAKIQLSHLKVFGVDWSIRRIERAIECGWQGLVFDSDQPQSKPDIGNFFGTAPMDEEEANELTKRLDEVYHE